MDQTKTGTFLKTLRKEKNLTQEQLAEQLGVSGRTVSRWETGSNMPDISLLVEIAEFYNISVTELIDGERRSGNMNEEAREVADKMADYAGTEKTTIIRNIRNHSLLGLCGIIVLFILEMTVSEGYSRITDYILTYSQVLIYVSVIMIFLMSTGLLYKFQKKQREINIPRPLLLVISCIVGVAFAVILKYLFKWIAG
ncbi:MAG: helix-turn-helix transcriptional regulator [Lachnospiraceae bacterium]|nr:helix-turn-helix transcriptional regulator [Lachnospiraceae bacterium]